MRVGWFLACLLLSDMVFASSMVVLFFPFPRGSSVTRTVRVVRSIVRMGRLLRTISLARRMLVPLFLYRRPSFLRPSFRPAATLPLLLRGRENTCFKRLSCEVFSRPNDKALQLALRKFDDMEDRMLNLADQGLKISLRFPSTDSGGSCQEKYRTCPFPALQLLETLKPLKNLGSLPLKIQFSPSTS